MWPYMGMPLEKVQFSGRFVLNRVVHFCEQVLFCLSFFVMEQHGLTILNFNSKQGFETV